MKNAYLYTLLSNVICWWIGHDIGKYNDSGYEVCQRCNKHEYYDYKTWDRGMPFHKLYRWIRHKLLLLKSWYKIKFFNELPF